MANAFSRSIEIDAPPDVVWALVSDTERIPEWFTAVASARMEGGKRIAEMQDGSTLVESVEQDDAARRQVYSVESGSRAAMRRHRAGFEVDASGEGSVVRWWTDAEPVDPDVDLEARIGPWFEKGLANLKALVEG